MSARNFALCGVGRDRPGIVSEVAAVLLRHGVNIEDSQATILRGHFSLVLVIGAGDGLDAPALEADLARAADALGLETLTLSPLDAAGAAPDPSHIVTVYGADHPGIVHAVTAALAEHGVDITDLQTRLSDETDDPIYLLIVEIAVPAALDPTELERALDAAAREQGVELRLRALDAERL